MKPYFPLSVLLCICLTGCAETVTAPTAPDTDSVDSADSVPVDAADLTEAEEQNAPLPEISNLTIDIDAAVISAPETAVTVAAEQTAGAQRERNKAADTEKLYTYYATPSGYQITPTALDAVFGHEALAFMDADTAAQTAQDYAEGFGMETEQLADVEVWSMTADVINAMAEKEQATYKDGSSFAGWTEEDEAYLVRMTFAYDGIPVAGYDVMPDKSANDAAYSGLFAMAIVGQDGVLSYKASPQYRFGAEGDAKPVCTAETALRALLRYHQQEPLRSAAVLTECQLQYVPARADGQLVFTPAWGFTEDSVVGGTHFYTVYLVDAFTGEMLGRST